MDANFFNMHEQINAVGSISRAWEGRGGPSSYISVRSLPVDGDSNSNNFDFSSALEHPRLSNSCKASASRRSLRTRRCLHVRPATYICTYIHVLSPGYGRRRSSSPICWAPAGGLPVADRCCMVCPPVSGKGRWPAATRRRTGWHLRHNRKSCT